MKEAMMEAGRLQLDALNEATVPFTPRTEGPLAGLEDLIGCFDSPADLSTNPHYFDGYGE